MTFFYSCAASSASHYVFLSIWSIWEMCAFGRRGLRDSNLELDRERCGCTKPQCYINKDYFKVIQSWPNRAQESPPLISKSVLLNSRQLTDVFKLHVFYKQQVRISMPFTSQQQESIRYCYCVI